MNDIAIPNRSPAHERSLIELDRSDAYHDTLAQVREALRTTPDPDLIYPSMIRQFARTRPDWQDTINRGLERQRGYLAALPDSQTLNRLRSRIADILAVRTEEAIRRQIALLLGAFPSGRPADPEIYVNSIIFDLLDMGFPDAVVAYACQDIRRSQRFLPTVSEIVKTAQFRMTQFETDVPAQIDAIEDKRQAFIDAIAHNNRTRDEVAAEIAGEERKAAVA